MSKNVEKQRGFSLVEVLVSFAILAVSLSVLFRSISDGARNLKFVEDKNMVIAIAKSRIASVGHEIPLKAGEVRGESIQGYRWSVFIRPYEHKAGLRNKAYHVRVIVRSGDTNTSLSTIKMEREK